MLRRAREHMARAVVAAVENDRSQWRCVRWRGQAVLLTLLTALLGGLEDAECTRGCHVSAHDEALLTLGGSGWNGCRVGSLLLGCCAPQGRRFLRTSSLFLVPRLGTLKEGGSGSFFFVVVRPSPSRLSLWTAKQGGGSRSSLQAERGCGRATVRITVAIIKAVEVIFII